MTILTAQKGGEKWVIWRRQARMGEEFGGLRTAPISNWYKSIRIF